MILTNANEGRNQAPLSELWSQVSNIFTLMRRVNVKPTGRDNGAMNALSGATMRLRDCYPPIDSTL